MTDDLAAFVLGLRDAQSWSAETIAKIEQAAARLRSMAAPVTGAEQEARALVARWEHGDEKHRQWLRDTAVPDVALALTRRDAQARAEERERLRQAFNVFRQHVEQFERDVAEAHAAIRARVQSKEATDG